MLTGVRQTVAALKGEGGIGIGLGVQSVLWSDSAVFLKYGEAKSNELMFSVTKYALSLTAGENFYSAEQIFEFVFDRSYSYACQICGMQVSRTFVLNALVPVDTAAHSLFVRLGGSESFDDIFTGYETVETHRYSSDNL